MADDPEENPNRRAALLGLLVVVVVFAVSWWVARELYASGKLQACLMSGRSNCEPIQ
jgi:hypothetical protein